MQTRVAVFEFEKNKPVAYMFYVRECFLHIIVIPKIIVRLHVIY